MKVLYIKNTDPYRNLAAEEYFLKQRDDDFFLLWQNAPCIVVGRNQNTYSQINEDYVRAHRLPVVRRLTGGGAVYHDLGNVNYTVIRSGASDSFGDYSLFCEPVLDALHKLGVPAELSGRNDVVADGKKICGNAQTMWHGRMLHHGCILFSADVGNLSEALRVNPLKIKTKGIDSVRSRVANLSSFLSSPMTAGEFITRLYNSALADGEPYEMTAGDFASIEKLCDEKYSTFDWNYGYPKQYSFQKETQFPGGIITVNMDIKDNVIAAFSIDGDYFGVLESDGLSAALIGTPYSPSALAGRIEGLRVSDYLYGMDNNTFLNALL